MRFLVNPLFSYCQSKDSKTDLFSRLKSEHGNISSVIIEMRFSEQILFLCVCSRKDDITNISWEIDLNSALVKNIAAPGPHILPSWSQE